MSAPWAIVPVKAFGVAKQRLSTVLNAEQRSRLGKAVAARTIDAFATAGAHVAVVTADRDVERWAQRRGYQVVAEHSAMYGAGLNGAVAVGRATATIAFSRWVAVHADLPLITVASARVALEAVDMTHHGVIVPSRDGGTNLLSGPVVSFRYGPGSFALHHRQMPLADVLVSPNLSIDLDSPSDLAAVRRHSDGAWIEDIIR
ncbi:MAG TPA: 2-phospho-L-lactate guanylyltransferase [Actinobacteria bacterium]|nr:2-phospho-L-lactate guanylyltransferase [bacterium BMS3Bbin02]HDL42221.1 2-phospho-L-lactate guanylyltransferase [Actinomycetota bacterium]